MNGHHMDLNSLSIRYLSPGGFSGYAVAANAIIESLELIGFSVYPEKLIVDDTFKIDTDLNDLYSFDDYSFELRTDWHIFHTTPDIWFKYLPDNISAQPSISHACELLNYVYQNSQEAKNKAELLSKKVLNDFNPIKVASLILDVFSSIRS